MKAVFLSMILGLVGCQTTQAAGDAYNVGDCFKLQLRGAPLFHGSVVDKSQYYYIVEIYSELLPPATVVVKKGEFEKTPELSLEECRAKVAND